MYLLRLWLRTNVVMKHVLGCAVHGNKAVKPDLECNMMHKAIERRIPLCMRMNVYVCMCE